jgi:HD superfamily phosphohydrolase
MNQEEEEMIRLAALLHDIGQGPFSHVSEFLLKNFCNKEALGETTDKNKIHEQLTIDIITKDPEIAKILTRDEIEYIASLVFHKLLYNERACQEWLWRRLSTPTV